MSRIDGDRLREVRNDVGIQAVLERLGVPTRLRGARSTFRCPDCEEYDSAINPESNLGYCFRCERSFNPIDLVMAERDWSFPQAVEYLECLLL